jgi:FtsZ-binding cell division protein ZapB
MIRFEQIQLLEKKIDKAVELINLLKKENYTLKNAIQKSQTRMTELENLLEQFKGEQIKIEEGLINALTKLDQLEDEVSDTTPTGTTKLHNRNRNRKRNR